MGDEMTPYGLSGGSWRPMIVWARDEPGALEFAREWLEFVERELFHSDTARVRILGPARSKEEVEAIWAEIPAPGAREAALVAGERTRGVLGLDGRWLGAFAIREGSS